MYFLGKYIFLESHKYTYVVAEMKSSQPHAIGDMSWWQAVTVGRVAIKDGFSW